MKILHVTDHYPPVLGGIETHVASLAERQALRGDDVTVLTSSPARADGLDHHGSGLVTVRRAALLTATLGEDFGAYDIVQAHVSVVAPFTAPIAALTARRGIPTVVTVHSMWNRMGPLPFLAAALCGLRTAPVRWTAVSRIAAAHVRECLPSGTEVSVLPNAVDRVRPRSPRPAGAQPVRMISTMRLARRKRPLPLLEMFAQVRKGLETEVTLTIVGGGPLLGAVGREVARSGIGRSVTLTDRVTPPEVTRLLLAADVYVAPAVLESFGLAALEARTVGLPVVGFRASGVADFVTSEVDGLLADSDADMVRALRRLVVDAPTRERIAEHNRNQSTPFTWARCLDAHDDTYTLAACSRRPVVGGPAVRA